MQVQGTIYDLSTWEAYLKGLDSSLPTTTAANGKICYYFNVAQACSADAISAWLHQSVTNALTWTPTAADCSKLLDKQRAYLETTANSLFGPSAGGLSRRARANEAVTSGAIATALAAGVTNFEKLVQSWVLRVGYYALTTQYAAFTAAINNISN